MHRVKNLRDVFGAIREAGVPDRFTHQFLKQLGFTSSGDRSVIALMKSLRFLDDSGAPTDRYKRYRDPSIGDAVMAEALRDAYSDLFKIKETAWTMNSAALKGAFKRISGKGDAVAEKMAATFKALSGLADWSASGAASAAETGPAEELPAPPVAGDHQEEPPEAESPVRPSVPALHHDVHVHLPAVTDVQVYDAIFRSLRTHFG
jgi:Family of unknown function (DUF5343)